jgi:hypothetical protein
VKEYCNGQASSFNLNKSHAVTIGNRGIWE